MIKRDSLVSYWDTLLSISEFSDSTVNGLQINGKENVDNIAFAVDASLDTIQEACNKDVDLLFVHHGLIWGKLQKISSYLKETLSLLFSQNINLYVSHLPLDFHKSLGNNIGMIKTLDLKGRILDSFYDVGLTLNLEKKISTSSLLKQIELKISKEIRILPFYEDKVHQKIAISSGMFSHEQGLYEAKEKGISLILTGETNSTLYHLAKFLNITIICMGHYASEVFGVKAIQEDLEKKYKDNLKTCFIKKPTNW